MMNIVSLSENTLVILLDQEITVENFAIISNLVQQIKRDMERLIIDIIPSYASIHITFNIVKTSGLEFNNALRQLIASGDYRHITLSDKKVIEIPVYYGKEVALDLALIADKARMSEEQVIEVHSNRVYHVYAIGFAPGFAYLGNVDERISFPRKATPRQNVSQGSLGIADQQTAIYPADSPGGWQIIGKTPIQLIDYNSKTLTQFTAGDQVKFTPISRDDYLRMGGNL